MNIDAINLRLKEIEAATYKIIREFVVSSFDGGLILTELNCTAEFWYATDNAGYRVTILGASPNNDEMRQWVTDQLKLAGFDDVEVLTEW